MNNLGVFLGVFPKIENQKHRSYAGFRVKFDSVSTTIKTRTKSATGFPVCGISCRSSSAVDPAACGHPLGGGGQYCGEQLQEIYMSHMSGTLLCK
jgi:hypothetical protein